MSKARLRRLAAAPAICRCAAAPDRSAAAALLAGRRAVPDISLPDVSAVGAPGRVYGLGRFRSDDVGAALGAMLPAALHDALRADFDWYACRGAFFHNDAHYGEVLFGAWCVAGPPREIVFARAGARLPAAPGDWVVFDPFEPHAVLDPGADSYRRDRYAQAPASIFIGFEIGLSAAVRAAFGIGPPAANATVLASAVAVNAETGAVPR